MLNYLRADFYRLRKSGAWIYLFVIPVLALIITVFAWITMSGPLSLGDVGTVEVSMGESALQMTANMGFGARLLMVIPACAGVGFVAADFKSRTFKSLLAVPHARRSYLASKAVVALAMSASCVTAALLSFWLFPLLFGMPYDGAASLPDAACWWVVAVSVSFGYSVLCLSLALAVGKEGVVWVLTYLVGFGLLGMWISMLMGACASALPDLSGILEAASEGMLYAQSGFAGANAGVMSQQDPAAIARAVLVPLGWAAACTGLSHLLFRRRSL